MNSYKKLKKRNKELEDKYHNLLLKVGEYIKNPDNQESKEFKHWVVTTVILHFKWPRFLMTSLLDKLRPNNQDYFSFTTTDRNKDA